MEQVVLWLNDTNQNGKMNGFIPNGSDADWSDEDAVKSGSATGYSETEQDDAITKKKQAIITAKSLNGRKYDPINMILDKIDAELSSLSKSQSSSATGSTVVRKPHGGKHRKTSGDDHTDSPRSGGSHKSEGTDTGLGTSSLQSEGDHHKINGSSELYSDTGALLTDHDEEGQKKGIPSDLDSVSAQQVDEKFKEIMRKKKGGYLENLKSGPGVSDAETVKTEDYEKKFREALVTLSDSDTLENHKSEADDESDTITLSDTESNRIDDLSWDYFDTVPARSPATVPKSSRVQKNPATGPQSPRVLKNNVQKSTGCKKGMKNEHSKIQKRTQESSPVTTNKTTNEDVKSPHTSRRDQNSTPPIYPRPSGNSPNSPRRSTEKLNLLKGKKKQGYVSDADSIRTEDFEVRFHDLIIKQPPESEGDTTDNDPLHDRVRDVLKATAPCKRKTGPPTTNNSRARSYRDESSDFCSDRDTTKRSMTSDGNTSVDEVRREIDKESARIQKELERERRSNTHSPRRDSKSPTRTMLSLAPAVDKSYEKPAGQPQQSVLEIPASTGRSSPILSAYQDSDFKTPPRHRSSSPRQFRSHQGPPSTSSSFQNSPSSSMRPQSASSRVNLNQEPASSGYYQDKGSLRGQTSSPSCYHQETPRSSSDFQESSLVSPRLSLNPEPSRSSPSPVFFELPRSSSPSPPRDNLRSLETERPSSPSQRSGQVSFTDSPRPVSPKLRSNSGTSYSQEPEHNHKFSNREQESLSASPRTGNSGSSIRDASPESDSCQDLSVLRARSLSPRPSNQELTTQNISNLRPRTSSPRPSALRESPISARSLNSRSSREGPENSSMLSGRNSFRGSEEKLSVSFQDQLPPQSQRHTRSQSMEHRQLDGRPLDSRLSRRLTTRRASDSEIESSEETRHNGLDSLQGAKMEIRNAERKLKSLRSQNEDARTQLMLTEFKRDNMLKDFERMTEELQRKKKELKEFEDQARSHTSDVRYQTTIGTVSDEKTYGLISENESLKQRIRQVDGLELERDELVRQLELTKEDLFNEQRKSRNQIEELKEEIENLTMQLEEGKNGSETTDSELHQRLRKMEDAYKKMEKEKNEIIHEKTKLYEDLRHISQNPRAEAKKLVTREVEELQNEVAELCRKVGSLQAEVNQKAEIIETVSDGSLELKQQLNKEKSLRESLLEDHRRTLQSLRKDMDGAMVQMREKMFLEKQQALETLRCNLEEERREAMTRADEKLSHQLTEHHGVIKAKEDEISRLIDLVKRMEEERRETERRLREETKEELQTSVLRERKTLESEHKLQLSREREQVEQEAKIKIRNLSNELDQERRLRETIQEQALRLEKDLEEQKQYNKQAIHDRMVAVARAKEQIRNEMTKEMEKVKDKLKQDHQREIDKLQETIRSQEEDIKKLKAERYQRQQHERQNSASMDRMERTLINEVNDECRKTANILGVGPRKVSMGSYPDNPASFSRSPTTAALANLRACNGELRNLVRELKQEMDLQKTALTRSEREKEEMVQQIKVQLEREKNMELERLKEKLSKEHVQEKNKLNRQYMEKDKRYLVNLRQKDEELLKLKKEFNQWRRMTDNLLLKDKNDDVSEIVNENKEETQYGKLPKVPPYEFRPRSEMQQQEIDRIEREIKGLAMHQNRMMSSSQPPNNMVANDNINAAKMIQHLESKLAQLQLENNTLRNNKFSYSSVPDLTNPLYYNPGRVSVSPVPAMVRAPTPQQQQMMSVLEQRAKAGEYESDIAAEQQERSRNMMSQKMGDMTKLQNTLTNQAKELIQLSRAYSNLNSTYPSPRMNNVR